MPGAWDRALLPRTRATTAFLPSPPPLQLAEAARLLVPIKGARGVHRAVTAGAGRAAVTEPGGARITNRPVAAVTIQIEQIAAGGFRIGGRWLRCWLGNCAEPRFWFRS